jgi:hypothetical protein
LDFLPNTTPHSEEVEDDIHQPSVRLDLPTTLTAELEKLPELLVRHLTPADADFVIPVVMDAVFAIAHLDCSILIPSGSCDPERGSSLTCIDASDCTDADVLQIRLVLESAANELVKRDPFRGMTVERARDLLGLPYLTRLRLRRRAAYVN